MPFISRSALEIYAKFSKHKGHSRNTKGHISAKTPLMFPNFEKSWNPKGHSGNIKVWNRKGHGTVLNLGNIEKWVSLSKLNLRGNF